MRPNTIVSRFFPILTLLTLISLAGCSQSPTPRNQAGGSREMALVWPGENGWSDQREGCSPLPDESEPGASIVFALTDSVSPGLAPIPHNPSERLVFSHLYETLVQVDCQGNLQPGLARAWTCTEDSTTWVFTLRQGARFWDGSWVTSKDVAEAWSANQGCPSRGDKTPLWTWFNARAKTVTLVDETRLAIRLPEPQARFPWLLAHPATAVSVKRSGWVWPVGSGPLRLRASTPAPLPDLECRPNNHHPDHPVWKDLTFRVLPGADPRDLIATDIDLALTRSLDAVRFFREMPGFQAVALPWNRQYLLVCPPQQNAGTEDRWAALLAPLDAAHDLTGVSARRWPYLIFPAGGINDCPQLTGPITMDNSARREWDLGQPPLDHNTLVYARGDQAGKELAQRLVALGPVDLKAAAVHPQALDFILNWQMAGGVILPLDQQFPNGCLQTATLLGKAAWLQAAALRGPTWSSSQATAGANDNLASADALKRMQKVDPAENLLSNGLVHPLAVTRPWLISRGQWAGLKLDFDGTPRLWNLGRPVSGEATP